MPCSRPSAVRSIWAPGDGRGTLSSVPWRSQPGVATTALPFGSTLLDPSQSGLRAALRTVCVALVLAAFVVAAVWAGLLQGGSPPAPGTWGQALPVLGGIR